MMDAIVIAGGQPAPDDSLYACTQGKPKAFAPIGAKPMIQWVMDALNGASQVGKVVVVGLPLDTPLVYKTPLTYVEDHGGMLQNIRAGAIKLREMENIQDNTHKALVVAADIPAITPEMVDWEISQVEATDHDIYYNLIERSIMEKRFPDSRRSYYYLQNQQFCGGDLNAINTAYAMNENPIWNELISSRKNAFKQAFLVGLDTLFLMLIRWFNPERLEKWVSQRLNIRGRVILCPYAETGMDIDKISQYELMVKDLAA